jgi:hypothetical protein
MMIPNAVRLLRAHAQPGTRFVAGDTIIPGRNGHLTCLCSAAGFERNQRISDFSHFPLTEPDFRLLYISCIGLYGPAKTCGPLEFLEKTQPEPPQS